MPDWVVVSGPKCLSTQRLGRSGIFDVTCRRRGRGSSSSRGVVDGGRVPGGYGGGGPVRLRREAGGVEPVHVPPSGVVAGGIQAIGVPVLLLRFDRRSPDDPVFRKRPAFQSRTIRLYRNCGRRRSVGQEAVPQRKESPGVRTGSRRRSRR